MLLLLLLLSHFSRVWFWDPINGSPPRSRIPGILQARILEWVAISFSNEWKWKVKVKSVSRVQLLATPWTAAHQAPLSMGFSRQEYWSGVPLPFPWVFIEPFNFSFFSVTGWGIDLDYCDIKCSFALETNRDHSVIFEIASKYCISDSFVDRDGSSISSTGFLPTVVDIMVIWVKFTHFTPF